MNDCAVGQYSSVVCAVYTAHMLVSVRALTSIAQVSTQRILHHAIIHATCNVQTEGKFAVVASTIARHTVTELMLLT